MWFTSLLRSLKRTAGRNQENRPHCPKTDWNRCREKRPQRPPLQQRRKKHSCTLQLEPLEARTTPTIVFNHRFGAEAISDGGGEVLSSMPIYVIFNGPYWQTSPAGTNPAQQVVDAITAVIDSNYLSDASQSNSNLPGRPYIAGTAPDPNVLSDGFGFVGPNFGLNFVGPLPIFSSPSFDWLPTGTLCGNVENVIDSGLLPDTDATSTRPLYLEVTAPSVQMHPGVIFPSIGPFPGLDLTGGRPSGMHSFYPDPDNLIPFLDPADPTSAHWIPAS